MKHTHTHTPHQGKAEQASHQREALLAEREGLEQRAEEQREAAEAAEEEEQERAALQAEAARLATVIMSPPRLLSSFLTD